MPDVKLIEFNLWRQFFVTNVEERAKDEENNCEDLKADKESFHRLIVARDVV
jgi:hypothetical protein